MHCVNAGEYQYIDYSTYGGGNFWTDENGINHGEIWASCGDDGNYKLYIKERYKRELMNNTEAIKCTYQPVEELHSAKCPHCGESYYTEKYSTTTCMYYPPIYKNGININPDKNTNTTYCRCINCGKDFSY